MTADRIKSFISEFQLFVWFPHSALTADSEKAEHFLLPATGNNQLVIAMGRLRITSFASDGCKSIKSSPAHLLLVLLPMFRATALVLQAA